MALVRKYFTYVEDIVYEHDFPGGRYVGPAHYIKVHYGPDVSYHVDSQFHGHFQDNDPRCMAWLEADDTLMISEGLVTLVDDVLQRGLMFCNGVGKTDAEALAIAQAFSPARDLALKTGQTTPDHVNPVAWDASVPPKLVQAITPGS